MLDSRTRITVDEYETIFSETLPEHGECAEYTSDVPFRLQRSKMIFVTTKYNGSIIYGTDESELILQPHFILGIKNISFSSMIKSRQNKQLRGRYAI